MCVGNLNVLLQMQEREFELGELALCNGDAYGVGRNMSAKYSRTQDLLRLAHLRFSSFLAPDAFHADSDLFRADISIEPRCHSEVNQAM